MTELLTDFPPIARRKAAYPLVGIVFGFETAEMCGKLTADKVSLSLTRSLSSSPQGAAAIYQDPFLNWNALISSMPWPNILLFISSYQLT
ncbi:hypothetical protein B5V01_01160 [Mesorhizobium erdmanii]|uniref:Uncharacterized protein n=2 Tax=Mesorhizobium TaxID=68287 RepID=A0A3M9XBW3_9HYPH|nr:hypothetical protein DNR46_13525 [Mesorhizobium japonicum]RXT51733.1 hypothetical protein B5V01_01160 [Mesorhizobium erdmanii]